METKITSGPEDRQSSEPRRHFGSANRNMKPPGKRILAGALIAASGAFVWALITFEPGGTRLSEFLGAIPLLAAYAVLITSWFVLPMGGVIGLVMPRIVRDCSAGAAFLRGILVGVGAGLVAAILTTVFMEWPVLSGRATIVDRAGWERMVRDRFIGHARTMIPICAAWVGYWAYRWSKKQN